MEKNEQSRPSREAIDLPPRGVLFTRLRLPPFFSPGRRRWFIQRLEGDEKAGSRTSSNLTSNPRDRNDDSLIREQWKISLPSCVDPESSATPCLFSLSTFASPNWIRTHASATLPKGYQFFLLPHLRVPVKSILRTAPRTIAVPLSFHGPALPLSRLLMFELLDAMVRRRRRSWTIVNEIFWVYGRLGDHELGSKWSRTFCWTWDDRSYRKNGARVFIWEQSLTRK